MFGTRCRACEARDNEITHLIGQLNRLNEILEKSQASLAELAGPGVMRRIQAPAQKLVEHSQNHRELEDAFPGYRRYAKPDPIVVDEGLA